MSIISCSDYVRVLKTSENVQCIWLQCDKRMFELDLPGFTVHNIKLDKGNEGKNGHGIAVLVAPSCSDYVRVLKNSIVLAK